MKAVVATVRAVANAERAAPAGCIGLSLGGEGPFYNCSNSGRGLLPRFDNVENHRGKQFRNENIVLGNAVNAAVRVIVWASRADFRFVAEGKFEAVLEKARLAAASDAHPA